MQGAPSARNVRRPPVETDNASSSKAPPPTSGDGVGRTFSEARILRVVRGALGLAMILGIGSGVAWGARRYVRTSARFAVSEIVTAGGKHLGPDEIANAAGIAKGQNVFSLDLDRARARLAADPWVESADIGRQLPGTITIRVTEHEPAGIVSMAEGTYLVTRDGAIIKRVEAGDPIDFDVVTGVALGALVDDREGATRTIRHALDLAYDYNHSPLAQRSPIQEVHVEPNGDMTLVVGKSGTVLRMGAAPYRRKLEQAVRIGFELDRRGAKPETILLDDEARPERVVVRMR